MAEITTNFTDSNQGDLGKNLVSKEYLIDVYPKLASQVLPSQIWCWGGQGNGTNYGLLTKDNSIDRRTPIPFDSSSQTTGWSQVTAGFGLKKDGTVWTWGSNYNGRLGINKNSTTQSFASTAVREATSSTNWKKIGLSSANKVAIKTDGTLWMWGTNSHGELGTNSSGAGNLYLPNNPVRSFSSAVQEATSSTNWKEVSGGTGHTLALKQDGTLWSTGANYCGQLGINNNDNRSSFTQVGTDNQWKKISIQSDSNFGSVYSESASLGLKKDASMWVWGMNLFNTFKISNSSPLSITPRQIFTGVSVPTNVTGDNNTFSGNCFISNTGILYTWGFNYGGVVGNNTRSNTPIFSPVREATSSTNWKQICGFNFYDNARFAGIKGDGTLWIWGTETDSGSLGLNQTANVISSNFDKSRSSPVREFTSSTNWKQVCFYEDTVLAIKTTGELWGWGNNAYGQLGLNDRINRLTPSRIGTETSWNFLGSVDLSQAGRTVHALKTNGTLWSWGRNSSGQLGVNDTITRSTPVQEFTSSTNWTFLSHGGYHVAAIKSDGSLWTWGTGGRGSLAINDSGGTSATRLTPVRESTLSTWSYCACGADQTYGIKTNGTLWSCGSNYMGLLGINQSIFSSTGTRLGGSSNGQSATFVQEFTSSTNWKMVQFPTTSSNVFDLVSRAGCVLALKTDGSLWAWGNNHGYHMGYNGLSRILTPVREGTSSTWKDISASNGALTASDKVFGIKTEGTLWRFSAGSMFKYEGSWAKTGVSGSNDENQFFIRTDGTLWSVGGGQFGSAGNNNNPTGTITQEWTSSTNWKTVNSSGKCVFAQQDLIDP